MKLLLDTHALLWALDGNRRLSAAARAAIGSEGAELLISSVCAFEITTKYRIGKLPELAAIARDFPAILDQLDYSALPVSMAHAALAGTLDHPHGDPFDRLLIAQARIEGVPIVSNEALFDGFGVERVW
ncbi:MAG TPA: type II toxin-antitoxin system VapC family toxin [Allosphingosinicella sp.]|nr:type II toxin-antitoxin system VapC family toxin [Allosphingosinicella sp.]